MASMRACMESSPTVPGPMRIVDVPYAGAPQQVFSGRALPYRHWRRGSRPCWGSSSTTCTGLPSATWDLRGPDADDSRTCGILSAINSIVS
jgi:hypothetical protein